jgi:hypothetical protein
MDDLVRFGSPAYWVCLSVLLFARGTDALSTYVATPNLVLEANPLARRLGWRGGLALNLALCAAFALWPLPAIVIATTSVLVAARNFQNAWLMRALGEDRYRIWITDQMMQTSLLLYLFCLVAQGALVAAVGAVLMCFSDDRLVPLAVGLGIVTYALAVVFYTLLSLWRIRRSMR